MTWLLGVNNDQARSSVLIGHDGMCLNATIMPEITITYERSTDAWLVIEPMVRILLRIYLQIMAEDWFHGITKERNKLEIN